jgi:PHD/YefM family antitoxin component YafN of YafNO toxin-antitoxin module
MQTATVTELRFKNKDILKKCRKSPIWIFRNGKRVAMIVGSTKADQLLKNEVKSKKTPGQKILERVKKYQIKKGPKNLSKMIDDIYQ